jgi:hypothetical protein
VNDLIEMRIISAVRELLTGRVNEILRNWQELIPIIEFGEYGCGYATVPVITLSSCEQTEKERIICLDAYSLTITFSLPETPDSELFCYGYSAAFGKALNEDPTLGGVTDRAVITGKKYNSPKKLHCGEEWGLIISLRVTVTESRE